MPSLKPANIPLDVRHLFKTLDERLIALLDSLSADDWDKPTIAAKWRVKDIVSHLLDGNIRALSIQRDGFFGENPGSINGYQELVDWLNLLNADWVKATKRISPGVLVILHKATGPLVSDYFASLDPWKPSVFPVDWAGEKNSLNWMHLAREYSEKWHHQQQIRDATNKPGIMTREFFHPAISTFFLGLPHTFRNVKAPEGTIVCATVPGEAGDSWYLTQSAGQWHLSQELDVSPSVSVIIPAEISWKLFTKSIRPHQVKAEVEISGDQELGSKVLEMVSVMA